MLELPHRPSSSDSLSGFSAVSVDPAVGMRFRSRLTAVDGRHVDLVLQVRPSLGEVLPELERLRRFVAVVEENQDVPRRAQYGELEGLLGDFVDAVGGEGGSELGEGQALGEALEAEGPEERRALGD